MYKKTLETPKQINISTRTGVARLTVQEREEHKRRLALRNSHEGAIQQGHQVWVRELPMRPYLRQRQLSLLFNLPYAVMSKVRQHHCTLRSIHVCSKTSNYLVYIYVLDGGSEENASVC